MSGESEYGLAGLRDKDGEVQAVDFTYEWGGEEITIKLRPPTIAEQEDLENLDDDAGADELESILDRHIVKPEITDSYTTREMWAFIEGLMRYSTGGSDFAQQVADELDERRGDSGN